MKLGLRRRLQRDRWRVGAKREMCAHWRDGRERRMLRFRRGEGLIRGGRGICDLQMKLHWFCGQLNVEIMQSMNICMFFQKHVGSTHQYLYYRTADEYMFQGRSGIQIRILGKSCEELPYFSTRTGLELTGLISGLYVRGRIVSIFALNIAELLYYNTDYQLRGCTEREGA